MALKMGNNVFVLLFALLLLFSGVYSVSAASSPARIVNGLFSNAFAMLMKWVSSLKTTTKTAITGRPMMKFEGGYNVETVFDGSKLGIEPYSVEVLPDGDLLILDNANSNLYKISSSLSLYSRPRLVTGSADGYSGHVDGKLRESRMNHPKGLTVDDRGNIYIADTDNMAIRKISDTGVTTIAGGKRGRGGGHVDGPSEDAKFSNDFDVVYLGSSCSLLVIDRGNKAIREIQLNFDDCAYQYGSGFPLGIAVLVAAGFFGYMLALLQQSYVIPDDDEAPTIETRTPTPKKTYAFMTKDSEKMQQLRQSRAFYSGWDGTEVQKQTKKQQNHHQYHSSAPQTFYEHSVEKTNEIVFGAVQENDKVRENVVIKPLEHGYEVQKVRSRGGYVHGR
ncbi:hypothetical protein PHJA_001768500 [Phtheirospermum japonicum]|uniref:NHL repeat containing protein n=1 Tax=Phtheirospermum japonicum TaxID=374723 RepID=A0A830CIW0_9LAMI|nr:hypothetical protein PHJA_001768500 [Phtheirospermum japonicum]